MSEPAQVSGGTKVPWWQTVLALLVLLALGAAIVAGGVATVRFLSGIEGEIAGAIITALGAVAVGTIGVVGTQFYSARASRTAQRREKLVPIYEGFVEGWLTVMGLHQTADERAEASEADDLDTTKAATETMHEFSKKVLVWGSPAVLKSWSSWRERASDLPPLDNLLAFEQVIFAMRKDLGMKDADLGPGDLLRLFINGWDEQVAEIQSKSLSVSSQS